MTYIFILQKYVTINANSLSSSEVRVIDAKYDFTEGKHPNMQLIKSRELDLEYYVDHHSVTFFFFFSFSFILPYLILSSFYRTGFIS